MKSLFPPFLIRTVTTIRSILPVTITILIAVLIAILIAITAGSLGAVKKYDKVVIALGGVVLVDLREHGTFEEASANDKDGHVCERSDYVCIRHDLDGRTVEEDVVIVRAQFLDQRGQTRLGKKLCRVGRHGADGKGVEGVVVDVVNDQRSPVVGAAVEIVGDALLGLSGKCAEGTFAKVKVDYEDLLALDSQNGSEVTGDESLSGTDIERCDHQYLAG